MKRGILVLLFLILLPSVAAQTLSTFPDMFIDETRQLQATIVVSSQATAIERIVQTEMERTLQRYINEKSEEEGELYTSIIKKRMDVQIEDPEAENLIIIGLDPLDHKDGNLLLHNANLKLPDKTGRIDLRKVAGTWRLIITGFSYEDIAEAGNIMKNFKDHNLKGMVLDVPRAVEVEAFIPSQAPQCGDKFCEIGKGENILGGPYYCDVDCELQAVESQCYSQGGLCVEDARPCPDSFGVQESDCGVGTKCCQFQGDPSKGYFYPARKDYRDDEMVTIYANFPQKATCDIILKDPDEKTFKLITKECHKGVVYFIKTGELDNRYGTWTVLIQSNIGGKEFLGVKEFNFRKSELIKTECFLDRVHRFTCELEGTPYEIWKQGGCGDDLISTRVSYSGIFEDVQLKLGEPGVKLEDGTTISVRSAPCITTSIHYRLERLAAGRCGDDICSVKENINTCPIDCFERRTVQNIEEHPQLPFFPDGIAARFKLFEKKEVKLKDEVYYITFADYGKLTAKLQVNEEIHDVEIGSYDLLKEGTVQLNLHEIYERNGETFIIISLRGQTEKIIEVVEVRSDDVNICEYGCRSYGKCMPYGIRFIHGGLPSYCELTKEVLPQKENKLACQNNYECESNSCLENRCIGLKEQIGKSKGFFARIFDKFLSWFS